MRRHISKVLGERENDGKTSFITVRVEDNPAYHGFGGQRIRDKGGLVPGEGPTPAHTERKWNAGEG